ncbi:DinB family protein [Marinoscillum furvescens]|uniref:DinB family protein n=1 Tax=Marinoscillum furvescens DSM 4134 TaxID=1122208 RepID=A0A3D9KXX1_MARFU|nr:DinB family protein [Marinoscillum furvescens]RED93654.1 DinB family protein [Marinoscillum furvescens DSM 4134]
MKATLETLLQQSHEYGRFIENLKASPAEQLSKKPKKGWSVLEVVEHLNAVYAIYLPNFEKAIANAPTNKESEVGANYQRSVLGRLSVFAMKPKKQKRQFKMKTFDFFEPSGKGEEVFDQFADYKEKFNELIRQARSKDLSGIKMPTALGEKVKFYVPECFEFVLAHESRHLQQIRDLL